MKLNRREFILSTFLTPVTKAFAETYQEYNFSYTPLAGHFIDGRLAQIVGISGEVRGNENVNYKQNLYNLWIERRHNNKDANDFFNRQVRNPKGTYGYSDDKFKPKKMTLSHYIREADKILSTLKKQVDWSLLPVSNEELNKLLSIGINTRDFMTYIMGSLFISPTDRPKEGSTYVAAMDHLLNNAGREYIESLPSFYEDGAIGFPSDMAYLYKGSAKVRSVFPVSLPFYPAFLKHDEHFAATYVGLISQNARLIANLEPDQIDNLEKLMDKNPERTYKFMNKYNVLSTINPDKALEEAKSWIKKLGYKRNKGQVRYVTSAVDNIYSALPTENPYYDFVKFDKDDRLTTLSYYPSPNETPLSIVIDFNRSQQGRKYHPISVDSLFEEDSDDNLVEIDKNSLPSEILIITKTK